jgi:hypothetical protein
MSRQLCGQSFGKVIRDSQRINGDDHDNVFVACSNGQSLRPNVLPDSFGRFPAAAESIESHGIVGRDIDRGDSRLHAGSIFRSNITEAHTDQKKTVQAKSYQHLDCHGRHLEALQHLVCVVDDEL